MTTSTASSRKSSGARRISALVASMLVWSCASLAAAEAPKSATANLQVSAQVMARCDISDNRIPTVSCVGTHDPKIDTAPAFLKNEKGEQVTVLVTTMNF